MSFDSTVIAALIGLGGVLAVQAFNLILSWNNLRKLDDQRHTLAGQDVRLDQIGVSVDGNLSHMRNELAQAVERVAALTALQERTMEALISSRLAAAVAPQPAVPAPHTAPVPDEEIPTVAVPLDSPIVLVPADREADPS